MLYRMKRNAVGLANICILSTMVMVMLSGTLALYLGQGEIIEAQYPASLNMVISADPAQGQAVDLDGAEALVRRFAGEHDVPVTDFRPVQFLRFNVLPSPDTGALELGRQDEGGKCALYVIAAEDYARLTGEAAPALRDGEAAVCGAFPEGFGDTVTLQGFLDEAPSGQQETFSVVQTLPAVKHFTLTYDMNDPLCIVAADHAVLDRVWRLQYDAWKI